MKLYLCIALFICYILLGVDLALLVLWIDS